MRRAGRPRAAAVCRILLWQRVLEPLPLEAAASHGDPIAGWREILRGLVEGRSLSARPEPTGNVSAVSRRASVLNLGVVPYEEAWELQRAIAEAVSQGTLPDTVLLLQHPPTVTLGRRAEPEELHIPADAEVDVVETDRGGKSTFHGPGQLVCYPILDLTRHGQDVKRYCRDLEEALVQTLSPFGVKGERIEGLTGVWLTSPPRKIASIGIHITRWVTTHGYALNVDLDPAPFTEWITACGLEDTMFTTMARELGRPIAVDDVRAAALQALADVFDLGFDELTADDPRLPRRLTLIG